MTTLRQVGIDLAHARTTEAITRTKALVRPSVCSACGAKRQSIHAHHDDYRRPLDVRWLCRWCHIEWHRTNDPEYYGRRARFGAARDER